MINVMDDGLTGYDDATDQWYRFDTVDQMQEHINAQAVPIIPERVTANTSVESSVTTITAPNTQVGLSGSAMQLIGADPNRQRITISVTATDSSCGVIVGNRETVMSSNGFIIMSGDSETFNTNCELWVMSFTINAPTSAANVYVSQLSERA